MHRMTNRICPYILPPSVNTSSYNSFVPKYGATSSKPTASQMSAKITSICFLNAPNRLRSLPKSPDFLVQCGQNRRLGSGYFSPHFGQYKCLSSKAESSGVSPFFKHSKRRQNCPNFSPKPAEKRASGTSLPSEKVAISLDA